MADETQSVEQEDQEADASGGDDAQDKAQQREERDPAAGDEGEGGSSEDEDAESKKAQEKEEEREQAREKVKELEEGDPPSDLEDWPDDAAKYETFGGAEGDHGYHEGPEEDKLGPSSLRHHEDGRVTVAGEEVDDPDEYKGEPIPAGPTDPDASQDLTSKKIREDQGRDLDQDGEDSDSDDDSEDGDSEDGDAKASSEDESDDSESGDSDESGDEERSEQSS
jgi:hypothetical protein